MLYHTREFMIDAGDMRCNCISFGRGERPLVMISGLNLRDAKGKAAALGLAWSYRSFAREHRVWLFDRREELPEKYSVRRPV